MHASYPINPDTVFLAYSLPHHRIDGLEALGRSSHGGASEPRPHTASGQWRGDLISPTTNPSASAPASIVSG